MDLLERQPLLGALHDILGKVDSGLGSVVLLGGEAGAGKTAAVQHFVGQIGNTARVMVGACDAMSTPRPLGPIVDVARHLGEEVRSLLRAPERRSDLFSAILDALTVHELPTVLVIEDVHWADEATIDLVRFVGRRLERTRVLIILTYRDDEVSATHPVRVVFGDLATFPWVERMTVDLLSREAVREMAAGTGIDAAGLFDRTDGNAFFVTEVIGAGTSTVPPSVQDAVLTRCARLTRPARAALDVASVIGGRINPGLLTDVADVDISDVDICIDAGLLRPHGSQLMFRHQLALEAVYAAIPPGRRAALHAKVLEALRQRVEFVSDFPRLAHHAEAAGDVVALLRYAPEAAKRASALGAHRQAAKHYDRVLRHPEHLTPLFREELLALAFHEQVALGNHANGVNIAKELIDIGAAQRDSELQAFWYAWKAWALVNGGQNVEANADIARARDLVGNLPASHAQAHVWQISSRLSMLNRDYAASIGWGERALELSRELSLPGIHAGAINAIGSCRILSGDPEHGRADLLAGLEIARTAGLDTDQASILTNLGSGLGEIYDFAGAEQYLSEARTFSSDRDLDGYYWYATAWLAMTRMFQGRWAESGDLALSVLATPASDTISRIMAGITLGRVKVRTGDPTAWSVLDEALSLSVPTGTLQRLAPVRAARAEAAWLAGDRQRAVDEAQAAFDQAVAYSHPWHIGDLGYWLWKAGAIDTTPDGAALPYARQMSGDWHGAATAWSDLGCPYESARALADSGEESALREAFAVFDRLGAKPAAAMTIRQLRTLGVGSIPRGARPSTRRNDALLTGREMEILSLVVDGQTNVEIAENLFLSTKTVEKHVSSILAKLNVTYRRKAAQAARERGIIDIIS